MMYYEINVTLDGKHFFATAERSIVDREKLAHVYVELQTRFPKQDGFDLQVTQYETRGTFITDPFNA